MSSKPTVSEEPGLAFSEEEVDALSQDKIVRLQTFRLLIVLANGLRNMTDKLLAADGLTTQQAAVLTIARGLGRPSFSECATALATSHQNVKQIALALERKGFVRIVPDPNDGRIRRLQTTPKNDRYWAKRNPSDHAAVLATFNALTPHEARTLFRLLTKLKTGLEG
ncbi:MAG: winged helix DNA-binding protein [Labilithrix sp.]|nr:winged helix DNA-binding protein [Labilithrix sp.]MCW5813349.1 winged helix DNA-binding protein [Labilithrix sp.]